MASFKQAELVQGVSHIMRWVDVKSEVGDVIDGWTAFKVYHRVVATEVKDKATNKMRWRIEFV